MTAEAAGARVKTPEQEESEANKLKPERLFETREHKTEGVERTGGLAQKRRQIGETSREEDKVFPVNGARGLSLTKERRTSYYPSHLIRQTVFFLLLLLSDNHGVCSEVVGGNVVALTGTFGIDPTSSSDGWAEIKNPYLEDESLMMQNDSPFDLEELERAEA